MLRAQSYRLGFIEKKNRAADTTTRPKVKQKQIFSTVASMEYSDEIGHCVKNS